MSFLWIADRPRSEYRTKYLGIGATHIHREDFAFIVVNGGSLVHVDPDNPADRHAVTYVDDQVVFIEAHGGVVHQRLTNVGTQPYRNFVIELKEG